MAKIRVGNGSFDVQLEAAIATAKPGDEIVLQPGSYNISYMMLNGVNLTGLGEPGQVVIRSYIQIAGTSALTNLTIEAKPFHNALQLSDARAELKNCVVNGEPTGKYPAIYLSQTNLSLEGTKVSVSEAGIGVSANEDSVVNATYSVISRLWVGASRATLNNVFVSRLFAYKRSEIECTGFLELQSQTEDSSLQLESESSCSIELLRVKENPVAGLCIDGYLQVAEVSVPQGQTYQMYSRGHSNIAMPQSGTEVIDLDKQPKDVLWDLKEARNFVNAVLPRLNPGDTLVLDEGEYHLEDNNNFLELNVNIRGQGRAGQTIVHGTLSTSAGSNLSIENITVRPVGVHNGILMMEGGSLSLTRVTLEHSVQCDTPLLVAHRGELSLNQTKVTCSGAFEGGGTWIDGETSLSAKESSLGWAHLSNSSRTELEDCSVLQILLHNNASCKATGVLHLEANTVENRELVVEDHAIFHAHSLKLDGDFVSGYIEESEVRIGTLVDSDGSLLRIDHDEASSITVADSRIELVKFDETQSPDQERETREDTVSAADAQPGESPAGSTLSTSTPAVTLADQAPPKTDPMEQINALIGLRKVKEQITRFTQMVRFNQARAAKGLKTTGVNMHSMFLGNPGTGKTTVARLLGEALYEAGAIKTKNFVEVGRPDLVGQHLGASAIMTQKVLESAHGGILFIDEAYSLHQENANAFGQEAVDTILTYMENHRDEIVVIFAGYASQMQDFLGMNPGLKSRIPNRFDFEDYSASEIAQIGYRHLLDEDYTVDQELYTRSVKTKYEQSSDNSNGRWVRNFNEELYQQLAQRVFSGPLDDPSALTEITEADIAEVMGGDKESKETAISSLLAELDALIGLDSVKDWVRQLVNRVTVDQRRQAAGQLVTRQNYHMIFAGNPGTGKTTVAKIIGQLFYNLGLLENGTVKTVDRTGLVGQYVGHTEKQTTKVVDEAIGGVLFVDEAYQLSEGSSNDFGRQAVETLITRLEDDRGKFVAIFAGYTDKMEQFLAVNPGLPSRIPLRIEFPDYSPEDVAQMVCNILAKSWNFDPALLSAKVVQIYDALPQGQRANGRWARNFAERVESAHINFIATHNLDGDAMNHITSALIESLS